MFSPLYEGRFWAVSLRTRQESFFCFRKRIFSPFPDFGIRSAEVRRGIAWHSVSVGNLFPLITLDIVQRLFRTSRIASKNRAHHWSVPRVTALVFFPSD